MDEKEQKIADFMHLYEPVENRISAYCRVITGDESAACDLLQDTLLIAFEGFQNLRKTESFIYYLCSIARQRFLNQKRKKKFFGDATEMDNNNLFTSADAVELQPDIQLLYSAISRLNKDQQEVLLMFHIMGFSLTDIQHQLNLSEAAVKNRLKRARARLKQLLTDRESEFTRPFAAKLSKIGLL